MAGTERFLNQDPIEVVTTRVLPSGDVEALLRLSERDMALLADPHPRYSIAPNPPVYVGTWPSPERCTSFWVSLQGDMLDMRCGKPARHLGDHDWIPGERPFRWASEDAPNLANYVPEKVEPDLLDDAEHNPDACGAHAVFWPDVEACDAWCARPKGHGGTEHEDDILGTWDERHTTTTTQEDRA